MKIYLASESPRRKKLIKWMGLDVEEMKHQVDEESVKIKDPKDLVGELALMKAYSVIEDIKEEALVIGSDLLVFLEGKKLGKPKDLGKAKVMLKDLRGKTHSVFCGVAVVNTKTGESTMSVAETKVKMKDYSDKVIEEYVSNYKVLDKGGAYAVQHKIEGYGSLVEKFDGDVTTIIGLPLEHLENLLKEFGVEPKKDWRKKDWKKVVKKETGYEY